MPNLDEFMVKHDRLAAVREKIRAALADMAEDLRYEKEIDFGRLSKVAQNDLVSMREHFAPHVVETGKPSKLQRLWVGNTDMAAKMRAVILANRS